MCGIAGAINVQLTVRQIKEVFQELALRGRDATGIAALGRDNHWRVWKVTEPANTLTKNGVLDAILPRWVNYQPKAWLFHTRQATHGSAREVNNAHPITSQRGLVIHNGIVHVTKQYRGQGQTDTEQLLLDMDRRGYRKALEDCGGYYALAYVDRTRPEELLLAKSTGASLVTYQRLQEGRRGIGLVFASTSHIAEPMLNAFSWAQPLEGGEGLWINISTGRGRREKIKQVRGGNSIYAGMGWEDWDGSYYETTGAAWGGTYSFPHADRGQGKVPDLRQRKGTVLYNPRGRYLR